jgi:hypothetical protein
MHRDEWHRWHHRLFRELHRFDERRRHVDPCGIYRVSVHWVERRVLGNLDVFCHDVRSSKRYGHIQEDVRAHCDWRWKWKRHYHQ